MDESKFDCIRRLREYVTANVSPINFVEAYHLIGHERQLIDVELQRGRKSAYGFTTLFGPNDGIYASKGDQDLLLESHLLGSGEKINSHIARAIIGVKLMQVSLGGTGVSPDTFRKLYEISVGDYDVYMAEELSYSSGDVVPGAWVVSSIFEENWLWNTGDIISLINGNYISTAYAYSVLSSLVSVISRSFMLIGQHLVSPSFIIDSDFLKSVSMVFRVPRKEWDNPPQLPVSMRDSFPLIEAAGESLRNLARVVRKTLSTPSANPLFVFDGDKVMCRSQSSFLNIDTRLSLGMINDFISFLSSYIQRVTEYFSSLDWGEDRYIESSLLKLTQLPKVSEALRNRIVSNILPRNFSGSMSGGVEDIWDTSLISSMEVMRNIDIVNSQLDLLEDSFSEIIQGDENILESLSLNIWNYIYNN